MATRVLYIAGYGRSGSTVFELTAASHGDVFAAGEVRTLFQALAMDWRCSCGERVRACDFWQRVVEPLGSVFPGWDWASMDAVTRRHERGSSRDGGRLYDALWHQVFTRIASISGASVVVDSSKTAWGSWLRPYRLASIPSLDVRVVTLVRHPAAVAASRARGRNRDLIEGNERRGRGWLRRLKGYAGWTFGTLVARHASRRVGDAGTVTYEAFVADPRGSVERALAAAGVDVTGLTVAPGMELDPGHSVGGNRLKRSPVIRLGQAGGSQTPPASGRLGRYLAALLWCDSGSF